MDSERLEIEKIHVLRNLYKRTDDVTTIRFPSGLMKRAGVEEYKSMGAFFREAMIKSIAEKEGKSIEQVIKELEIPTLEQALDFQLTEYKKNLEKKKGED